MFIKTIIKVTWPDTETQTADRTLLLTVVDLSIFMNANSPYAVCTINNILLH